MTERERVIAQIRGTVQDVAQLSELVYDLVADARRKGCSWDVIAAALTVRYQSGARDALGNIFPGGISGTTARNFYNPRIEREARR